MFGDGQQIVEPPVIKRSITEGQSKRFSATGNNLALLTQNFMPCAQDSLSSFAVPHDSLTSCAAGPLSLPISALDEDAMKTGGEIQSLNTADNCVQESHNRRIEFKVPTNELHSTNKNALSPLFELPGNPAVKVKMILSPPVCSDNRGGASFRKCSGKDLKLAIKCEEGQEVAGRLKFSFYIGVVHGFAESSEMEEKRAPLVHDFSYNSVASMPKDIPGWNFDLKSLAKEDHLLCGVEFISESQHCIDR